MYCQSRVSKWSNSLAIRIPLALAKQARLSEGDSLAIDVEKDGSIVLRSSRRTYELSELVSQITPGNRHRETEWGEPQGEESW
jgi:antitoxin MazE